MIKEEQIQGSINSVDRQLLYDIREEIRTLNRILSGSTNESQAAQDKRRGPRTNKGVE